MVRGHGKAGKRAKKGRQMGKGNEVRGKRKGYDERARLDWEESKER